MTVPRSVSVLVLSAGLLVAPSLRVLCSGSCVDDDRTPHAHAAADQAPDCHEDRSGSGFPSGDDDCRHSGEASWSSLSASAKTVGVQGSTVALSVAPVGDPLEPARLARVLLTARVAADGQSLGLFLTPLRI